LSQSIFHDSPLLSEDNDDDSIPCFGAEIVDYEGYEAQISTSFGNRLIRTWWQPEVEVGRPCPHENAYRRTTHCSLTSNQVLLQVKPSHDSLWINRPEGEVLCSLSDEGASMFFQHHKHVTARLSERQGPFEHGRLCIVRCGDQEGPADPLIILAASLGLKAYIFHFRECWNCALTRMIAQRCTLGIVTGAQVITKCGHCTVADDRANRIITELGM
jgi:hypothetical protein